jgi:hypothetical protein
VVDGGLNEALDRSRPSQPALQQGYPLHSVERAFFYLCSPEVQDRIATRFLSVCSWTQEQQKVSRILFL